MRLYDTYLKYKKQYPDTLLFIKSGNFYEALQDDAYILHFVFHYKMLKKKRFVQVGFPEKLLDQVMNECQNLSCFVIQKKGGGENSYIRPPIIATMNT